MSDVDFLYWILDRLVNVHNENANCDYMHRLRKVIYDMQCTPKPIANMESIIDLLKSAQGFCRLGFEFQADDTIQSVINLLSESKDNNNE